MRDTPWFMITKTNVRTGISVSHDSRDLDGTIKEAEEAAEEGMLVTVEDLNTGRILRRFNERLLDT